MFCTLNHPKLTLSLSKLLTITSLGNPLKSSYMATTLELIHLYHSDVKHDQSAFGFLKWISEAASPKVLMCELVLFPA